MPHAFRLASAWQPDGGPNGAFAFALMNLGMKPVTGFKLAYTSLKRVVDAAAIENATLVARDANFHQFAPPEAFRLEPGGIWRFTVGGLQRAARHRTDGPKSACVTLTNGRHINAAISDLLLEGARSDPPPVLLPDGKLDQLFAIQPWPRSLDAVADERVPVVIYPADPRPQRGDAGGLA